MGLRDFHSFNLAMLAEQAWRLINDPEPFCARVLGAKYYPHDNILNAVPKAGSTFTWQSILAGLTRHNWRVGNGSSIKIWDKALIPTSSSRKIVISSRRGVVYTRVSKLINPVTSQWDEELFNDLFLLVVVSRILQIPINNQGFEDFITWHYTKHGCYTVR